MSRMPPAPGQRNAFRAFRASVLLLPLALVCYWLWARPGRAPSRFDDELDRALSPVMVQSDLQRRGGALTSGQARLVARDLAERSIAYLGPRDLDLWAATRVRVARASPSACAHLWKGGDESFLGPAIAELGPEALEAYVQMLARALALHLEELRLGRRPVARSSAAAIERGFATIAQLLPVDAREQFERDVRRRDVSDARACELFLTVQSAAEKLEPGPREDFYRALADALTIPRGVPATPAP